MMRVAIVELLISQLTDIFRIGLLVALLFTMLRNQANTGIAVPLIAGAFFVAVIIPAAMPIPGEPLARTIASGLVANAVILALLWAIWLVIRRWT
jgi:hypothetical protein